MAKLDFSSIQSNNPLIDGSARKHTSVDGVKLSFSTLDLKTDLERKVRDEVAARRFRERAQFEASMDACVKELTREAKELKDNHAMIDVVFERSRLIRAHKRGGDAIYEAVEALMAASDS